ERLPALLVEPRLDASELLLERPHAGSGGRILGIGALIRAERVPLQAQPRGELAGPAPEVLGPLEPRADPLGGGPGGQQPRRQRFARGAVRDRKSTRLNSSHVKI